MIYTSYFAKLKQMPKNIIPIAICGKSPNGYKGLEFKKLAPRYWFFQQWKQTHDNEFYIENYYKEVLDPLNPKKTVLELKQFAHSNDIVLVCYEKPEDFCHRHLVSKWLNRNGFEIKEWINEERDLENNKKK